MAKKKAAKKAVEPAFPETLFVRIEKDYDNVYYSADDVVPNDDGAKLAIYTLEGVYTVKTTVELE